MIMIICIKFGWIGWKLGGEQSFKNCKIGNLAKCTEWPQTKLKESGSKSTFHMCTVEPRVPNFPPFHYTISCFRDIPHFSFFQLTPMLNFQSAITFLNFGRLSTYTITFLPHDYLIYHKVWLRSHENRRRRMVLKYFIPWGPMLTKTKTIHKIFKIENFEKTKLPTRFGLDPCSDFRETGWVYGRRTDGRLRHDSSSADKSSRAKSWCF